MTRAQKITLGAMRTSGVRGLLICCSDYRCSHWTAISGDRWADHVRLSDLEPLFTCQACGKRGAEVGPDFSSIEKRPDTRRGVKHAPGLTIPLWPARHG